MILTNDRFEFFIIEDIDLAALKIELIIVESASVEFAMPELSLIVVFLASVKLSTFDPFTMFILKDCFCVSLFNALSIEKYLIIFWQALFELHAIETLVDSV